MRAFISWSGGKDAMLSYYRAAKKFELDVVVCLLNMAAENGLRSRSHRIRSDLLQKQAEAMGIVLTQKTASWNSYEEEFKKTLREFEKQGIRTGVFGDIDLQPHRDWVEKVCEHAGIKPVLPLWQDEREKLVREFIAAGFKAMVLVVNEKYMGKEWLGRIIDEQFITDLKVLGGVDVSGEKGEYHTFVFDGPNFKKPVVFSQGEKEYDNGYWFLDLRVG